MSAFYWSLTVLVNDEERDLTVCGVYQDVTNGGKTAKAILPCDTDNILLYIVNLDVKDGTDIPAKIKEYAVASKDGVYFPTEQFVEKLEYHRQYYPLSI